MPQKRFTKWFKWKERNSIDKCKQPGVYAIAISKIRVSGKVFKWDKKIVYFGMTNSKGGILARINQFDRTIQGKDGHGGAYRVINKYSNYKTLVPKLYVSICPFDCDVTSNKPKDLNTMGEVAKFEYVCFAKYVHKFKRLPEFNDKERSPKKRT